MSAETMTINNRIADVLKDRISKASNAHVELDGPVRVGFQQYSVDQKAEGQLVFTVKNPARENTPKQMEDEILAALGTIDALKPHIKVETETNHMKRLAGELTGFIQKEAELNEKEKGERFSTIPRNTPKWFEELPKRNDWNIEHALNIEKKNTGVIDVAISVPKDVDSATIVKNIEDRKQVILETLADRVVKYTPGMDSDQKKADLKEAVKKLHLIVSANETPHGKRVNIQFLSQMHFDASQTPNGYKPDKIAEYVASTPLTALQNGENDKDPSKPQPRLQKALSRAILFAGGEKALEIFPLIAGREDMARAVGKSLTNLKKRANDPDLTKKIDLFLGDEVFKNPDRWGVPVEQRPNRPESVHFFKDTTSSSIVPYQPGLMQVTIDLPGDKATFTKIQNDIAALTTGAAAAPAAIPTTPTAAPVAAAVPAQAPDKIAAKIIAQHQAETANKPGVTAANPDKWAADLSPQERSHIASVLDKMEKRTTDGTGFSRN